MSIAVDQVRLRTIVETLLPSGTLGSAEADTVLQFVRIAAGADDVDAPAEHSVVQCIAQKIAGMAGLRLGDVVPTSPMENDQRRIEWLRRLGQQLRSREARELTYALAYLTIVADLVVTPAERDGLEALQVALGIDDARATDLIIFLAETVVGADEGSDARSAETRR